MSKYLGDQCFWMKLPEWKSRLKTKINESQDKDLSNVVANMNRNYACFRTEGMYEDMTGSRPFDKT